MSFGRLAVGIPPANTDTVIYTVPANCLFAEITLNILNPDVADITVNVAVALTGTPSANEYVEQGAIIPANGGILERTNLLCSPGENIVVRSTLANTVVRVSGKVSVTR